MQKKTVSSSTTWRNPSFSLGSILFKVNRELKARIGWRYFSLVGIFCLLAYVRGLSNLFVAEDFSMIVFSSLDFGRVWKLSLMGARIKPLPLYVGWLLYRIFGAVPIGYHLFVLVLHILNCALVFCLVKRLGEDDLVGLVASLLFSVYPRHHQPVLWLAADQFVMVGTFILASLLCFDTYLRTRKAQFQIGAFLCVCLAVASNELGITVLPLLFLVELIYWRSRQQGWGTFLRAKTYLKYIPYLTLLIVFAVVSFGGSRFFKLNLQQVEGGQQGEAYHLRLGAAQIKDLIAYLTHLVYPHIPLRSLDVGLVTGIVSGLTLLLLLLFLLVKGRPVVRFTILWIGFTLMPFVLFVPFGNADRYFYVAAIGFSLLWGSLGCLVYSKLRVRFTTVVQVAAVLVIGIYLISSVVLLQQRINEWRQAGQIAADIVEQTKHIYPRVPRGSKMLFAGLPDQHEQAYVFFGGGIGGAIYLAYGEQPSSPSAYQTRDPAVASFLREAGPVDQPLPGLYVFLYEDGVLYDKTGLVDSLKPLRTSTWYR
ncbi:MAG: hypothetical protein SXV54_06395 [Chloroflexota bacterium]|nr:hypothetical protein [Chloroflexota bacterium]